MKKLSTLFVMLSISMMFLANAQPYREQWEKMHDTKAEALEEFNEAKFGLFIHWGLYAQPAGIWKGEEIAGIGEWIMYRAKIPREEYRELCKDFNPVRFDADSWVKLAKDAGMKYIVAMPKHHDGFSMYNSAVTDYDIYDATPFKRDPIAELYKACQKQDMRFGFYYSHATDWMDGGDAGVRDFLKEIEDGKRDPSEYQERGGRSMWPANTWDPAGVPFQEYIDKKAIPQVEELLEKFPDSEEIWFDVPMHMTEAQSFRFYKTVYDLNPEVLINSRIGNDFGDYWIPGDNKIPETGESGAVNYWETPGTMNNTWGYKSYDLEWKSVKEIIFWITEIVSKGGNYLLNVGPKADGTIPRESIDALLEVGQWVKINGEAIYGSHQWKVNKEGPTSIAMKGTQERAGKKFSFDFTKEDFWFTSKDKNIYAFALSWPEDNEVLIKSLKGMEGSISDVKILGQKKSPEWESTAEGLKVTIPSKKKLSEYGYTLKITLK